MTALVFTSNRFTKKKLLILALIIILVLAVGAFAVFKFLIPSSDDPADSDPPPLSSKESYEKALPDLERKASGSSDPTVINQYAAALRATGNLQKASQEYLRSYKLEQSAPTATSLATIYRDLKDVDQAIEYYQKALDLDPTYILAVTQLMHIYEAKGESNKAITLLETSISAASSDKIKQENLHLQLANLHRRLGNTAAAKKHYQTVLKLNPNNLAAQSALEP